MISLPELLRALKGLVVMSNELEAVANSIAINQVPESWSNVAYPSMKPCSAWFLDLLERLKFITGEKYFVDFESFFIFFDVFCHFLTTHFVSHFNFLCLYPSHSVSLSLFLCTCYSFLLYFSLAPLSLSLSLSITFATRFVIMDLILFFLRLD